MTYVVLVILIALWAMVLLPPYLKDRRSHGRTFSVRGAGVSRSRGSSGTPGLQLGIGSASPTANSAQRFLPLQQASATYATSRVSSPTGMRTSEPSGISSLAPASNVVPLRPVDGEIDLRSGDAKRNAIVDSFDAAFEGNAYLDAPGPDESSLHDAWQSDSSAKLGVPRTTSAARERRRHVLLALTGLAFASLLLAIAVGGRAIALHVGIDVVMLGYVILLVRHRQIVASQLNKVEPIRPPVTDAPMGPVAVPNDQLLHASVGH